MWVESSFCRRPPLPPAVGWSTGATALGRLFEVRNFFVFPSELWINKTVRVSRVINLLQAGLLLGAFGASQVEAAQAPAAAPVRSRGAVRAPAPAPVPPETISRTPEGGVTIRAVRIPEGLKVDGRLDESYYREVTPIGDFIQQEPTEGEPATEKTEAWIFFDNANLYVSARCWDSSPEREIANEMRRDSGTILQNENFGIVLDTFNDKRNGFLFQSTPLAAQRDGTVNDERQNVDWNGVWDVKTERFEQGWTVEFAIPFKTLRYDSNPVQVWGINLRRIVRWKNEWTFVTPMPAYLQSSAIFYVSLGATLVGIETPPSGLNLEVKPYAISGVRTDRRAAPPFVNDVDGDVGMDAKYGLSKSMTLDLTYNPDFAQVEDDTQQVNLTRFNQFFPERREFFLEGQGLFSFGGSAPGTVGGGAVAGGNAPLLFFSRRIGLNNGRPIPIAGGARLTGRAGANSFALLNIQAREDEPSGSRATNFSAVRARRDVLQRSYVGLLYTRRDETAAEGAPTGQTWGVDGMYSFSPSLSLISYYARTEKPGVSDLNASYLTSFNYNADRYGLQLQRLKVGELFNPEVGFLRRSDFVQDFVQARFSPRPAPNRMKAIRRFILQGNLEYMENNQGRLDFREQSGQFGIEFFSSDRLNFDYTRDYEFIPRPFAIASNVTVPVGGYTYQNLLASYSMGTQHKLSGTVSYQHGSLYGGTKRTLGMSGGRAEITPQFTLEPSFSLNWVDLPWGEFTSSVITERTTYTLTPRMFVSALTQYNSSSHTFSINARFRWEYRPGSEVFVVYSDGRDTAVDGAFLPVINRAFVVKVNRLLRF